MDQYSDTQSLRDAETKRAWDSAPAGFKRKASELGISYEPEGLPGMAMEYDETKSRLGSPGHSPSFYTPDPASIDTLVDQLVEKYGTENEKLVRAVAEDLKKPMNDEIQKSQALTLFRVACCLAKSETNVMPRVHALLHTIPRLAAITGFGSMRQSAKFCRVSCEWIRRQRDRWCDLLELPIPQDGRKSDEAKAKYSANGHKNHWRKQRYSTTTNKPICLTPIPKPTAVLVAA